MRIYIILWTEEQRMSFRPASHVPPDVNTASLRLRTAIRQNPHNTTRMYDAICQLLEILYRLPLVQYEDPARPTEHIFQQTYYERQLDRHLTRLHRWVVQWPLRGPIDDEMENYRQVYMDNLVWIQELDDTARYVYAQDYLKNYTP